VAEECCRAMTQAVGADMPWPVRYRLAGVGILAVLLHIYISMQLTTCALNSDLCKFGSAPELPEGSYCMRGGASVYLRYRPINLVLPYLFSYYRALIQ